MLLQTFIMASARTNLNQRVGLFDLKNGVFLSQEGSTLYAVVRSYVTGSAVDDKVAQSSWNLDKLDGTGASGITLDLTKPQILTIDFEWLGVGRVRFGLVFAGVPVYFHQSLHSNYSGSSVFMSNPNLPTRWEIEATGTVTGTPILESICASVSSEGGYQRTGADGAADTDGTPKTIASAANAEVIAIRMQSAFTEFSTAFVEFVSAVCTSKGDFRWRLVRDPTETAAGTWVAVSGSIMEFNTTRTVTIDTGRVIGSGFVSDAAGGITITNEPVLRAGTTLAGVTDIYSLQVYNTTGSSDTYHGSIKWRELY